MIESALGIIDKMRIEVYAKKDYKDLTEVVHVQLNPEKYTMKHNVVYCEGQAMGSSGGELKFNKIEGQEVIFDFVFDSSGVVPPPKFNKIQKMSPDDAVKATVMPAQIHPMMPVPSVEADVEKFKDLLMKYDGKTHQPPFLWLIWGGYNLKCRLKSMDIDYTLFNKDGRPVRAKAKCHFKESTEFIILAGKENKQSPDMTHERTATMNDKLTLLAEDIYGNNDYYIDVAKNNKLLSFRKTETGQTLHFPPVK